MPRKKKVSPAPPAPSVPQQSLSSLQSNAIAKPDLWGTNFKRPKELPGHVYHIKTSCGTMYITVTNIDGYVCETFLKLGRSGTCVGALLESIGRLISICRRYKVPIEEIEDQLKFIHCQQPFVEDSIEYTSCPDAIAKQLRKEQTRLNESNDGLRGGAVSSGPKVNPPNGDTAKRVAKTGLPVQCS